MKLVLQISIHLVTNFHLRQPGTVQSVSVEQTSQDLYKMENVRPSYPCLLLTEKKETQVNSITYFLAQKK